MKAPKNKIFLDLNHNIAHTVLRTRFPARNIDQVACFFVHLDETTYEKFSISDITAVFDEYFSTEGMPKELSSIMAEAQTTFLDQDMFDINTTEMVEITGRSFCKIDSTGNYLLLDRVEDRITTTLHAEIPEQFRDIVKTKFKVISAGVFIDMIRNSIIKSKLSDKNIYFVPVENKE